MKKYIMQIGSKPFYFLPLIITLFSLFFPSPVLAQESKDGLILNFASGYYDGKIAAGESKTIYLEVANKSDTSTTDVQFSYNAPDGWVVEFHPSSIDILKVGSFEAIEVDVTAPANINRGDYPVTIIADSSAGRRIITTYFWVEKGANIWAWVGGALGVVIIVAFFFIYRRFTRE